MSVAIGFEFAGGIVLCADSEYTHGNFLKTSGAKIARVPARDCVFMMAGAGNQAFMQAAFECVRDQLGTVEKTTPKVKRFVEGVLLELYQRHIYPVPDWASLSLDAQFLIGFRTPSGLVALWVTQTTHVIEVSQFESIGVGQPLATYLAHTLYRPAMTEHEAKIVATVFLKEVKRFVPYCGGESGIVTINSDPDAPPTMQAAQTTRKIENAFECLKDAIRPAMIGCLNWQATDGQHKEMMDSFLSEIAGLRSKLKATHKMSLGDLSRGMGHLTDGDS